MKVSWLSRSTNSRTSSFLPEASKLQYAFTRSRRESSEGLVATWEGTHWGESKRIEQTIRSLLRMHHFPESCVEFMRAPQSAIRTTALTVAALISLPQAKKGLPEGNPFLAKTEYYRS